VILRPKSPNQSYRFLGPNRKIRATSFEPKSGETVATGFEAKSEKTVATSFKVKPGETIWVVLRPNHSQTVTVILRPHHWQTVDLDFEAQPRNPRFSSPRARYRPHTTSSDLSIARPPSTRPVRPSPVLYTMSSTPAMILVDARHAAPVTCTPRAKQTQFSKRKIDNGKTTKMSQIRIQTSASQWLITIKPRKWPFGFSEID
jgi:hypothetical protein